MLFQNAYFTRVIIKNNKVIIIIDMSVKIQVWV